MRSRTVPLVIALVLAVTLVGCSDSSTEPDTSEPAATQPPSTTATTDAPTTTTKAPTTTEAPTTTTTTTTQPPDPTEIVFIVDRAGPKGTFVATGGAVAAGMMCPEGDYAEMFRDDWEQLDADSWESRVEFELTCTDGSGSVVIECDQEDSQPPGGNVTSGPWTLLSGTSAYADMTGSGKLDGEGESSAFYIEEYEGNIESQQDQLVGMWTTNGGGKYVDFNDDGTYGKGYSPEQAMAMDPSFERGTWSIEEGLLTFTASQDSEHCSGVIGTYEVEIADGGDEVLVTLIEDSCDPRSEDFPSGLTRHTDT